MLVLVSVIGPSTAFAQGVSQDCESLISQNRTGVQIINGVPVPVERTGTNLQFVICRISQLLNTIVPILIILGVIFFIWGVVTYVIAQDDEAKTRGRDLMIYGLIGLLVIVSMWGLVAILKNTFGISGTTTINVPCIPSPGVECRN